MSVHVDIYLKNDNETQPFEGNASHDPFIRFCQALYDWVASTHSPFQEYEVRLSFLNYGITENDVCFVMSDTEAEYVFRQMIGFILDFCVEEYK